MTVQFLQGLLVGGTCGMLLFALYGHTQGYKWMLPVAVIVAAAVIAILATTPVGGAG